MTEKNVHMYFIGVTEGKFEKLKNEGKMRISILIFIHTMHFAYLKVYTKFENTGSNRSREICDKFSLERKKNEQIKGLINNMWLFFGTQYNSSLSSFVPNFRILSQVVAEKSLTEKNVLMYFYRTEGKIENLKKEGKMRISILIFIYTIHFAYLKVYI